MISFPIFPVLLGCAALFLGGCERITEADKQAAVATVQANVAAMKTRNVEAITKTVHPQSPHFEQSKAVAEQFDLLYDLKSAEVESVKGGTIRVRFVQETRKLRGPPEFKDNLTTGIHVLRRDGAAWKLWATEELEIKDLGPGGK